MSAEQTHGKDETKAEGDIRGKVEACIQKISSLGISPDVDQTTVDAITEFLGALSGDELCERVIVGFDRERSKVHLLVVADKMPPMQKDMMGKSWYRDVFKLETKLWRDQDLAFSQFVFSGVAQRHSDEEIVNAFTKGRATKIDGFGLKDAA